MKDDLAEALGRLCTSGDSFESAIAVLQRHPKEARRPLQQLLRHPDPAWRRGAATAMARLQSTPRNALPDLLKLLRNPDASAKIAALAAIEQLPPTTRRSRPSCVCWLRGRRAALTRSPVFARTFQGQWLSCGWRSRDDRDSFYSREPLTIRFNPSRVRCPALKLKSRPRGRRAKRRYESN